MQNLLIYISLTIILIVLILFASYFINIPTNDYEKHSSYECGFEPFGDARSFFDIHFYTIGLLFIIFDLEIIFLIPAVVNISDISFFGFINLIIFLLVVLLGFYYEWCVGLLNWLPEKNYTISDANKKNYNSCGAFLSLNLFFDIISNIDLVFLIFCILIAFSLIYNSVSINFIHRVINLAILIIGVAGLWVFFTSNLFFPTIYIFIFVGAVVMLFLSVVLMLPSSVMVSNFGGLIFWLFTIKFETISNISYINVFWFILLLFILYFICFCIFKDVTLKQILNSFSQIKTFVSIKEFKKFLIEYFGINYPIEVWERISRNEVNIKGISRNEIQVEGIPKRYYIMLYFYDCCCYIYECIESRSYLEKNSQNVRKNIVCVWGNFFDVFIKRIRPARPYNASILFPYMDPYRTFSPYRFRYSLYNILEPRYLVKQGQYLEGTKNWIKYVNRIIFIKNLFAHFFINFIWAIFLKLKNYLFYYPEIIKHFIIFTFLYSLGSSIFLYNCYNKFNIVYARNMQDIDNLLALKHELYENNPMFLFLSVIGLLLALIGVVIFFYKYKKSL